MYDVLHVVPEQAEVIDVQARLRPLVGRRLHYHRNSPEIPGIAFLEMSHITIRQHGAAHDHAARGHSTLDDEPTSSAALANVAHAASNVGNLLVSCASMLERVPADSSISSAHSIAEPITSGRLRSTALDREQAVPEGAQARSLGASAMPGQGHPATNIADSAIQTARSIGISPASLVSWSTYFADPRVGIPLAVFSIFIAQASLLYIHFSRSPLTPLWIAPTVTSAAAALTRTGVVWRHGPVAEDTAVCKTLGIISVTCAIFVNVPPYFMALEAVPFHSRFRFAMWHTVHVFGALVHQLTYSISERPASPHRSVLPLFITAGIRTVKLMDSLTDIKTVRVYYDQVPRQD